MLDEEKEMSNEQTSDNSLSEVKPEKEKGLVKRKIREFREDRADFIERNDPIYTEPLTPVKEEQEGTAPLCRHGVDKWFLIWAMMLLCFGIVMC